MSKKDTQQMTLEGETPPSPHLRSEPIGSENHIAAEKSNEWFCLECKSRITVSPDGEREYGHQRDCEHALTPTGELDWGGVDDE